MKTTRSTQQGFSVIEVVLLVLALAVIGLIAWLVLGNRASDPNTSSAPKTDSNKLVQWSWQNNAWVADGVAPSCPDPLIFLATPTDMSKVTSVLYPGQKRGGQYKPHGGFRLDGGSNDVTVKAIMDGYLTSGARYIEQGEVQYVFTITNSCGIAYRYDHLAALSPAFQTIANSLPAAKVDDSRTTNFDSPVQVKTGDAIATAVGFKGTANASFDLGVYDYRKRNVAANSATFVSEHQNELSQAAYAVCWFDMFPSDATRLRGLPSADPTAGKTSDYCD